MYEICKMLLKPIDGRVPRGGTPQWVPRGWRGTQGVPPRGVFFNAIRITSKNKFQVLDFVMLSV